MKHFLLAVLIISCLTATCFPAFAAVECTVPKNLSGAAEAPDVPILERVPDKTIPADTAEQEMAKGRPAIWLLLAVMILVSFIPEKKKLFSRWFTGNMKNDGGNI